MNHDHAKYLRQQMTDAEHVLWRCLREHRSTLGKFRRQQPIGTYIVDFVNFGAKVIVEADGGQHNRPSADSTRDGWLQQEGFKVLRFWNNDILQNTTAVLEAITTEVLVRAPLSPGPSPTRGEGSSAERFRPIRSYVLRQGRMTDSQRRALEELWPRYGVTLSEAPLDLVQLFGRSAPVILEIGFGNGDALVAAAAMHPERNYLGVEVHAPGVGSALLKLDAAGLTNARVIRADINEVLARVGKRVLQGVHLFFPDPWPKKRHHKRRLLQGEFAARLRDALAPGGYLHCATDWEDYAVQMLSVLEATTGLENVAGKNTYAERPASRPVTRFESRGNREGRPAKDLVFRRVE